MEMIENGMVLNQEKYDSQMKSLPCVCELCKEECNNVYDVFTGKRICQDCFDKLQELEYNYFIHEFLNENPDIKYQYEKYLKDRLIHR